MEENKDRLATAIESLTKYEAKSASAWWTFIRGMMYGLGFFIGSAILAAAVLYILSRIEGWSLFGGSIQNIIDNVKNSKS